MRSIATEEEIAEDLDVPSAQIPALVAMGMPRRDDGRFDVAECALWRIQQLIVHGHPDGDEAAAHEIALLRELVTGERAMELALGDFVTPLLPKDVEHIRREYHSEMMRRFREKIETMPERVASAYAGKLAAASSTVEARQYLTEMALDIMRDLARTRREMEADGWTPLGDPPEGETAW